MILYLKIHEEVANKSRSDLVLPMSHAVMEVYFFNYQISFHPTHRNPVIFFIFLGFHKKEESHKKEAFIFKNLFPRFLTLNLSFNH